MSMFWNGGRAVKNGGMKGTVLVRVLGAALVATLVSSCASMERQSGLPINGDFDVTPAQKPVEPPDVRSLDPAENQSFVGPALDFLRSQGYSDASNVLIVTIAYTDGSGENLVAFKFDGSPVSDLKEFPLGYFVIPEVGADFKDAIVIYTRSPSATSSCTPSGGTVICRS